MDTARVLAGPQFYDCSYCAQNPGMLVGLGHDGPPLQYWRENLITGEPLDRCPLRTLILAEENDRPLFREIERMKTYFAMYRNGFLLEAGGVADQPALYLDYMRELDVMEKAVQAKYDELRTPQPGGDA